MGYVMKEWYGISIHFLIVFGVGVVVGMSIDSHDPASDAQAQLNQQLQPTVTTTQPALISDEDSYAFMRNWCAANFGK